MKARLPQGFGGGAQNMQGMIKQAQKMQDDMAAKQEELQQREFTTASGGGAVEVKMNGKKEIVALNIKPDVVDADDIEMLEDLIIGAVNECVRTIEQTTTEEMEQITGGLNLPGLF